MDCLFSLSGIGKKYPGVQALSDAHLELHAGEVHALVGENGAGKSTLSRIISGLEKPDGGSMRFKGSPYEPDGKRNAEELGIRMVMQELNLVPTLSVAENIFLNRLPSRAGLINRKELRLASRKVIEQVGLKGIDPGTPVADLGIGQQQMVEIAAGMSQHCELLILDEPTAALTDSERELLFKQIQKLKTEGVCIIYISHRMEEIKRISDRITVLRDGIVRGTLETSSTDIADVISLMVGREMETAFNSQSRQTSEPALRAEGICRGKKVRDVSFELYKGEILGFAGMMGSGRTELMRLLFGADKMESGKIYLDDSEQPSNIHSPSDAVKAGIALLTEDRKEQGLLLPQSISVNTSLARMSSVSRMGWINPTKEQSIAEDYAASLSIKCHSVSQSVKTLSGGNQQKVVMAKWLHRDPSILIFDEPTRGIDVGAKFEIYNLLSDLAAQGRGIILVSSDMLELLAVCDRIAVMSNGSLAGVFKRGEWSDDLIMEAALSRYTN
ncbi:MAG: sugar ABC transporter ATP-binding protein [Puniceicoccaceae bacterium]